MRTPSGGVMAAVLWAVMLLIAVAALVAALRAPLPGDPPTGQLRHASAPTSQDTP